MRLYLRRTGRGLEWLMTGYRSTPTRHFNGLSAVYAVGILLALWFILA